MVPSADHRQHQVTRAESASHVTKRPGGGQPCRPILLMPATKLTHQYWSSSQEMTAGDGYPCLQRVSCSGGRKLASLFRDDPLVSRGHAHIYLAEDHSVQVADLNSTNGTFVNGKAIRSLTRLTGGDVLRIGSIGMRLDSPRADSRPADKTVRRPAAHFSWSDTLAGRRAPETPRYENGHRDFPSTGAWPDAQAKAHAGLGEPAPASAVIYPPPGVRASWPGSAR